MRQTKRKKRNRLMIPSLLGLLLLCSHLKGYSLTPPPSEDYHRLVTAELPSEVYYNENLRSGPPAGPGGSEEGGNSGTGTKPIPIGEGLVPLTIISLMYIFHKKGELNNKQH